MMARERQPKQEPYHCRLSDRPAGSFEDEMNYAAEYVNDEHCKRALRLIPTGHWQLAYEVVLAAGYALPAIRFSACAAVTVT